MRTSIRQKILGIAVGLIVLMAITSVLSAFMARTVAHQLDELTTKYMESYAHLARLDIRSLERALALRRILIARMQSPPDSAGITQHKEIFEQKGIDVEREASGARALIKAIIADPSTASNNTALVRIELRIEDAMTDRRGHLVRETERLLALIEAEVLDFPEIKRRLARVDELRDEFDTRIEGIRTEMMAQVRADAAVTKNDQQRTIWMTAILAALAASLGLAVSVYVSSDIVRPVRRLLDGTLAVEKGYLDASIDVTTRDEIGQLTSAFNGMVEQLRHKEKMRETFGRYIDPRVVEGLIDRSAQAAIEGERRVMTVLFCDMKGFTRLSEGTTPQGLVRIMNHYLSTMSEPIRGHFGIIDKYIGDAIMAYWGPPFNAGDEHARLACLTAIDMIGRVPKLLTDVSELLGVRTVPGECDIRIGIATGEVLVGSIGSEFMMSYTVMGDAVNLASRLESANKLFGCRSLISEATKAAAGDAIETREIDRIAVFGQSHPLAVFEIMAPKDGLTPKQIVLRARYAEGLAAYRGRNWERARIALSAALEAVPDDSPSIVLMKRIEILQDNPPAEDWDGSWHLEQK